MIHQFIFAGPKPAIPTRTSSIDARPRRPSDLSRHVLRFTPDDVGWLAEAGAICLGTALRKTPARDPMT
jgi:hypothetical protein